MKLLSLLALSALGVTAATAASAATFSANAVALSLSKDGRAITTIAGSGTGNVLNLSFAGGALISLDDIDFRPATGGVFGYDDETDTVYSINLVTGFATAEVTSPGITNSGNVGFDFNNRIDAARVVNDNQQNVVYAPNAEPPTLTAATPLFYQAGDVNAGKDPTINMNAYTNAVVAPTSTLQFVIDTGWDVLATLNNSAGNMSTVGSLFLDGSAFDAMGRGGFDILSFAEGDNTPYALLFGNGVQALYTFDVTADALGNINLFKVADLDPARFGLLSGLTVVPSAVPLPATALLLMGGLGLLGAAARRRRS